MKKTAVEWLIGRFHYEGFIGHFCSEEAIKSKREIMIEIIDQAKAMEKEQIVEAVESTIKSVELTEDKTAFFAMGGEGYYNETYESKTNL